MTSLLSRVWNVLNHQFPGRRATEQCTVKLIFAVTGPWCLCGEGVLGRGFPCWRAGRGTHVSTSAEEWVRSVPAGCGWSRAPACRLPRWWGALPGSSRSPVCARGSPAQPNTDWVSPTRLCYPTLTLKCTVARLQMVQNAATRLLLCCVYQWSIE